MTIHLTYTVLTLSSSVELNSLVEKLSSIDVCLQHTVRFLQSELTLITLIPKTVVMVEATLANPVAALFLNIVRHLLDGLSESG